MIITTAPMTGPRQDTGRACRHDPPCPPATAIDHAAARVVANFPEQGWALRCNGVISFDDRGELLPDGTAVAPCPAPARHRIDTPGDEARHG